MIKNIKTFAALVVLVMVSCPASGTDLQSTGGFPGEYLNVFGSNAARLGLGSTGAAASGEGALIYYNPASLAGLLSKEATVFYAPLFEDANYSWISVSYPIETGMVVGIARAGIAVGGIDKYNSNGESNGTATAGESAYFISYGQRILNNLDAGINLKIIYTALDTYSATGFGIDLGAIYRPLSFLSAGLAIQNILPPSLTLKSVAERYPTNVRAGVSAELLPEIVFLYSDVMLMDIFPDTSLYADGYQMTIRWFEGLEIRPVKSICVRGGINYKEITAGAGYKAGSFDVDYGIGFHSLGLEHRVSISARFGVPLSEKEKALVEREKEAEFRIHYSKALDYCLNKKYDSARAELKLAMDIKPDDKEALALLGKIDAEERLYNARMIFERGLEDFESGNETVAQEKIKEARAIEPKIAAQVEDECFEKAKQLSGETRDYEASRKLLRRVLFINPDNRAAQEMLKKINEILEILK